MGCILLVAPNIGREMQKISSAFSWPQEGQNRHLQSEEQSIFWRFKSFRSGERTRLAAQT